MVIQQANSRDALEPKGLFGERKARADLVERNGSKIA